MTDFSPMEPFVEILRMKRRVEEALAESDQLFMPATAGVLPLPPSVSVEAGACLEEAA
jgi:hypothetical protein